MAEVEVVEKVEVEVEVEEGIKVLLPGHAMLVVGLAELGLWLPSEVFSSLPRGDLCGLPGGKRLGREEVGKRSEGPGSKSGSFLFLLVALRLLVFEIF